MKYYNLRQSANVLGIPYHTLYSALREGRTAEPKMKIGSTRVFTKGEIKKAANSLFIAPEDVDFERSETE